MLYTDNNLCYFILFNNFSVIKECEISSDLKHCHLLYQIPSMKETGKCINALLNEINYSQGAYETFHAIRMFFLLYAAFEGGNEGFPLQKEADGCGR